MNGLEKEQEEALLAKRRKLLEVREEELRKSVERLEKEKNSLGCGKASDVIQLNVGGTLMATLRKTLTYIEDSMLAAQFSGRWDNSIEKDKDGIFFIDQPIDIFLPMIDFIRSTQSQTPSMHPPESPSLEDFGNNQRKYRDFKRMVKYFGATPGIFPVKLVDYSTSGKKRLALSGPSSSFKVAFDEWKICRLAPYGHTRKITGYEVKIGEAVDLQIGWVHGPIIATAAVIDHSNSIALNLERGGITCNSALEMVNKCVQNGTFVACKHFGKEWYIDGDKITGSWKDTWQAGDAVPVISGKGEWTITSIELEP